MTFKISGQYILLTCAAILINLSACDADPAILDTNEPDTNAVIEKQIKSTKTEPIKHTLWKVNGNSNTLYLMGSIHMLKPEHYPLPDIYDTAYAEAEQLVFEIDDEILNPAAAQSTVLAFAQIAAGQRLADIIDKEDYSEIKELATKHNVPMFLIDPFDPWFSSLNLVNMQYLNAGLTPEHGIDQHYMQRALADGKPVLGLETIEQQFSMFDSISMDIQTEMLIDTLKQEEDIIEFVDKMIKEWQEGDMDALEELLKEDFEEYEEMYNVLLKNRNENWIIQFLPMLKDSDDYLVIVGAAHMLGEDGVVELLEAQGFTVEQL
jgi:uncharacterized protein YbaP (TraB family)